MTNDDRSKPSNESVASQVSVAGVCEEKVNQCLMDSITQFGEYI